ncbi:MAG: MucR family transcriptional regulator [Deltaproteobacteria bacterium]|jgi:predicted transcriptional regulator|nr:MucR family transcriptional regulator [Deltaproteobacteria bacterium]MBW2503537.1 MucR family transcriptional regulator [Deltaproteobacteria bacterium]MBW2519164.1 MucR family transcriptional regulator [Deltaproteobacteria bacterium]
MATLLEMAAEIVAAHASTTNMTKEELVTELSEIYNTLSNLEKGEDLNSSQDQTDSPAVTRKKAFGKDKIYCMICGKGMKTLSRHLKTSHNMTASEYRKQFDIPRGQSLAAKSYSETRRKMAIDRGLGEKLAKARAARGKKK